MTTGIVITGGREVAHDTRTEELLRVPDRVDLVRATLDGVVLSTLEATANSSEGRLIAGYEMSPKQARLTAIRLIEAAAEVERAQRTRGL